ncbi:MAG: ATP-binding cassette domain-containing protein [Actinomycetota bacterium]|nr:ATP-binding cassette domain-containing protein [Actinomycetota bacterium]
MLGPSGCGKSTLYNILQGLEEPDHGKIIIDGKVLQWKDRKSKLYAPERPSSALE